MNKGDLAPQYTGNSLSDQYKVVPAMQARQPYCIQTGGPLTVPFQIGMRGNVYARVIA